jgi:hypothetical protein
MRFGGGKILVIEGEQDARVRRLRLRQQVWTIGGEE